MESLKLHIKEMFMITLNNLEYDIKASLEHIRLGKCLEFVNYDEWVTRRPCPKITFSY